MQHEICADIIKKREQSMSPKNLAHNAIGLIIISAATYIAISSPEYGYYTRAVLFVMMFTLFVLVGIGMIRLYSGIIPTIIGVFFAGTGAMLLAACIVAILKG